jgi:hypothetical protein
MRRTIAAMILAATATTGALTAVAATGTTLADGSTPSVSCCWPH